MQILSNTTLGIDFGTSNSAMSWRTQGQTAQLVPLEGYAGALPTALFFNYEDRTTHYGRDAMKQYLGGEEGRLMRSLKSLLGSSLLQDKTAVHGKLVSYQDVIAMFLKHLAQQAQQHMGGMPERVVLGRPVHFVDGNPERDALAQSSLEAAAHTAGFQEVAFQLEPIAAALDYEQRLTQTSCILVADIGGGTSDFTVVRLGPQYAGKTDRTQDILATTGVHIGGTDFDYKLNVAEVQPLLGLGHIGPSGREVPSRTFYDLSTWHLIQWLYTAKSMREVAALRNDFSDRNLHARLMRVLEEQAGHRLADAVEQAKICASSTAATALMDLGWVESGLAAQISPQGLEQHLQGLLAEVMACAEECVTMAGLRKEQITALYLTGGSSALQTLRDALKVAFPTTPQVAGDLFGGVASGLAYA